MRVYILYPTIHDLGATDSFRLKLRNFEYSKINYEDISRCYKLVYQYGDYPRGGSLGNISLPIVSSQKLNESLAQNIDKRILNDLYIIFYWGENPLFSKNGQIMLQQNHLHPLMLPGTVIIIDSHYYVVDGIGFTALKI